MNINFDNSGRDPKFRNRDNDQRDRNADPVDREPIDRDDYFRNAERDYREADRDYRDADRDYRDADRDYRDADRDFMGAEPRRRDPEPAFRDLEASFRERRQGRREPEAPAREADHRDAEIPRDFGFENEHPQVNMPFALTIDGITMEGISLSITSIQAEAPRDGELDKSRTYQAQLRFSFENFSVALYPEVRVLSQSGGEVTLQFTNPAGEHLPQLRYILNSYLAGDMMTLGKMMSHTGPTTPVRKSRQDDVSFYARVRGILVAILLLAVIYAAGSVVASRYTQSYEARPVFVEIAGRDMRATSAGQIGFLDTSVGEGEVMFTIQANNGDILSYVKPCNCEATVSSDVFPGATVLPSDLVATLYESDAPVVVRTRMSVEGLARALSGDQVYLDFTDGKSVAVEVRVDSATNEANQRGDATVPVDLVAPAGELNRADVNRSAIVRLSRPVFGLLNRITG